MVVNQKKSKRKPSGARLRLYRKKKSFELGRVPALTKIGPLKRKIIRVLGGNSKVSLLSCDKVNVFDSKTKKYKVAKIIQVKENPANRHFVRRNIITKGSIIETDIGNARVTSRPGREATINAVLVN